MPRPHLIGSLLAFTACASAVALTDPPRTAGTLPGASSARGALPAAPSTPCPGSTFETVPRCSRADLDGDGIIGFTDLTTVLSHWGAAPTAWTLDHGTAFAETRVQPDAPSNCMMVRALTGNGLGALDAGVAQSAPATTVAADMSTGVTISGADTVLTIAGATSYDSDGVDGADATAVANVAYEFDVLEPIACTLVFTSCNPTAATRLIGDNGFERVCTPYAGVLEPGHYTLRGNAFSDDVELIGGFGAILTLHDIRGADLDDDGTIGLGDVLTILSAWGPCGS